MSVCNPILVAFGSNADDDPRLNADLVRSAIARCNATLGTLRNVSDLFQTPAFPAGSGPDYVNACACFDTGLEPSHVLERVHAIEAEMGRVRTKRWGQRVIDIDLLAAGDRVLPDAATVQGWIDLPLERKKREAPGTLILPHPRLQDRGFVLVPLAQIAPDWRHPLLDETVQGLLDRLDPAETAEISRI